MTWQDRFAWVTFSCVLDRKRWHRDGASPDEDVDAFLALWFGSLKGYGIESYMVIFHDVSRCMEVRVRETPRQHINSTLVG